jgi:hypothetical protein
MRIKDTELKAVLAAIEDDLNKAFESKKEDLLAKAAGDKPDDAPAEASDSDPASASSAAPDTSAPASAPPDAAASAPADAGAPPPGAAPADPAAPQEAPLTPEALQAEYSQLAPEELDMHIKAALAAKEALMASAAPAGMPADASAAPASPAGSPPAGPPAPPAASPAPGAPPDAMKAEITSQKKAQGGHDGAFPAIKGGADGGKGGRFTGTPASITTKSEEQLELEKLVKSQAEDIENLTKAVKMVLERPERKAVTSIAYLNKSEPVVPAEVKKVFTPAEARAKLNDLIPTLTKSEREIVHDFYAGKVDASKLAPILDKAK